METTIETIKVERYPAYKDSGVEWIGEVPEGWEVKRLKYVANVVLGKMLCNEDKGDYSLKPYLKSKNIQWLNVDISSVDEMWFSPKELVEYRLRKGDLVLSEGGEVGKTCIWNNELEECYIQNSAHKVSFDENYVPEYYLYLLFIFGKFGVFDAIVNKVSIGHLTKDKLINLEIAIPPLPEQSRIAAFLDRKTAQIDQAIAQKERLIELLKERRQILIHNAVTRGLNPNVKMKDSGVEWIGEVPEGWEVKRLKYFSTVQSGITLGKSYTGTNHATYPYLRVANVQAGYFDLSVIAEITIPIADKHKYLVRAGDILVTEGGDIDKLGRGTIWQGEIEDCLHQNHIFAIRVNASVVSPEFVELCLGSDYGRKYFTNTANKTTNLASTNSTKLGNFPVVVPSLSEQHEIMNYVSNLDNKIATAITLKQSEIEKTKRIQIHPDQQCGDGEDTGVGCLVKYLVSAELMHIGAAPR